MQLKNLIFDYSFVFSLVFLISGSWWFRTTPRTYAAAPIIHLAESQSEDLFTDGWRVRGGICSYDGVHLCGARSRLKDAHPRLCEDASQNWQGKISRQRCDLECAKQRCLDDSECVGFTAPNPIFFKQIPGIKPREGFECYQLSKDWKKRHGKALDIQDRKEREEANVKKEQERQKRRQEKEKAAKEKVAKEKEEEEKAEEEAERKKAEAQKQAEEQEKAEERKNAEEKEKLKQEEEARAEEAKMEEKEEVSVPHQQDTSTGYINELPTHELKPWKYDEKFHPIHTKVGEAPDVPTKIPRILHFVYVSPHLDHDVEIPVNVTARIQHWQELNPGWVTNLWTSSRTKEEFAGTKALENMLQITCHSGLANIIRYHVMMRYGGVYLDTDIIGLHSLEPLVQEHDSFTVCQDYEGEEDTYIPKPGDNPVCATVCTAVIAAKAEHPALQDAVEHVFDEIMDHLGEEYKGWWWIGPYYWNRKVKKYGVNILPRPSFYPCHYNWAKVHPCLPKDYIDDLDVFGIHIWEHSWKGDVT